jgi:hypothetical protein
MKRILPFLLIGAAHAADDPAARVDILRQNLQGCGVIWDMPAASAAPLGRSAALVELWSIDAARAEDRLVDQKLFSPYLPKANLRIKTLDPHGKLPCTRVDQPFTVEIEMSDLLTGADFPLSASTVLLERELVCDPEKPASDSSHRAYLSANGKTVLRFAASALTAADPTKASGVERFSIHAISDGSLTHTRLASGSVQVWPVASGAIRGISHGDKLDGEAPRIELQLHDLYPRSNTYLLLYEGTQINGNKGVPVKAFPMDGETSESHVLRVNSLRSKLQQNGTYTLALVSDTVFGRELLCDPVSFTFQLPAKAEALAANAR